MLTWDMMLRVSAIEDRILALKRLTCDGSMLQGHTINQAKAEENKPEIQKALLSIKEELAKAEKYFHAI